MAEQWFRIHLVNRSGFCGGPELMFHAFNHIKHVVAEFFSLID